MSSHLYRHTSPGKTCQKTWRQNWLCLLVSFCVCKLLKIIFSIYHHSSYYFKLLDCLENVTKKNCTSRETNSIQELIRNMIDSLINVSCGDFTESSDRCETLPPPPRRQKADKDTKAFVLPLVEVWNSLED